MVSVHSASVIGIDLAWSDRNLSGLCALDATGHVVGEALLDSDAEILTWIEGCIASEGHAVVAVDAPLHVPNLEGRRPCETELSKAYGARKASTHSSNRSLHRRSFGRIRGEELALGMSPLGFGGPWSESPRVIVEVYPHPGLIEVFGLPERLLYKRKRGVGVNARRLGLQALDTFLLSLTAANPPMHTAPLGVDVTVRGKALKAAEDRLDARFCAWMALLWLHRGRNAFTVFGDADTGHIAVPAPGLDIGLPGRGIPHREFDGSSGPEVAGE